MMMFYADEFKSTEKRIKTMASMTAKEKVALSLLTIIDAFGFDKNDNSLLDFTPSRKDISSIAGTTYETVIRVLSESEKSKIIVLEGTAIRILDINYLKTLCKKN